MIFLTISIYRIYLTTSREFLPVLRFNNINKSECSDFAYTEIFCKFRFDPLFESHLTNVVKVKKQPAISITAYNTESS